MSALESEYRLDYFEEEGFTRTNCPTCGDHFWTRDTSRETCGEPPCETYSFIHNPGFDEEYSLSEMREVFLSFFESHDHERIEPYPVAANRWRDDVLLTQASIMDFQPLVTNGTTPPPGNPLTISQPCIRMQDIDDVGRTGRHTMAFEMMAHHAFNARKDAQECAYEGEVYWKEQAVAHCDELLDSLGVDLTEVIYIEDPWVGGGNAGPALEVIYRGVELATLVFMTMEQSSDGEYELKDGNTYTPMDTYVVDTGYGLERWTWVSQGTPTVYEAVYPEMIAFLKDDAGISHNESQQEIITHAATLAGNMDSDKVSDIEGARKEIATAVGVDIEELRALLEPLETIYAIADHCRTLAYMLGDEIIPSNVSTGYLVRMVLRRTKRLVDSVDIDTSLHELVNMQAERLGYENRETIRTIVQTEIEQYHAMLDRGSRRVRQLSEEYADHDEPIPADELVELYDSHGIQPDTVEEIARKAGAEVSVPGDFYSLVAARQNEATHEGSQQANDDRTANLSETERLYYDDQDRTEFEGIVLDSFERDDDGYDVILDRTLFYPEGGGQPSDTGTLSTGDFTVEVDNVRIENGVIIHRTSAGLTTGERVRGCINATRRSRLMHHHTATHIVAHAARKVLGEHIRQAGAQKGVERSRIDLCHYERITRKQAAEIERHANKLVMENVPVTVEWSDRHVAEKYYGFDIYQGGIPPGERIRLIHITDDIQACGGTHVTRSGDIGTIRLLSTKRVQDGVERLSFAAGEAAIAASQQTEDSLHRASEVFDVTPISVPETAERFFTEWKERGKRIADLESQLAKARATSGVTGKEIDIGGVTAVVHRLNTDVNELRATASALAEGGQVAVVAGDTDGAQFTVAVPEGVGIDAGAVVNELAARVGGSGGGSPNFAHGGGPRTEDLDETLDDAPEMLRRVMNA